MRDRQQWRTILQADAGRSVIFRRQLSVGRKQCKQPHRGLYGKLKMKLPKPLKRSFITPGAKAGLAATEGRSEITPQLNEVARLTHRFAIQRGRRQNPCPNGTTICWGTRNSPAGNFMRTYECCNTRTQRCTVDDDGRPGCDVLPGVAGRLMNERLLNSRAWVPEIADRIASFLG